jgi:ribosome maturation factor RimP
MQLTTTTQDEELAVTERSAGLPSAQQVMELLNGEFARAGCEIEDVAIDERACPPRITVVADADKPLDLDAIADLSHSASELLDGLEVGVEAYVLEVTSRGVDRPLTEEKHFRRARGRLAQVELSDGATVVGRIGAVHDGSMDLLVRDRKDLSVRRLMLADIVKAVVQVEFSPPNAREMELLDGAGRVAETEAGA